MYSNCLSGILLKSSSDLQYSKTSMATPAASKDTTVEVIYRDDTKNDLNSLTVLQAEMTKTTKELEKLRLGLSQSNEKVEDLEKHRDAPDESFVIPGLPKERTKLALERISARQQGLKVTELSVKERKESNLVVSLAVREVEHFSDEESLAKKHLVKGSGVFKVGKEVTGSRHHGEQTRTVADDGTIGQSLSTLRLGERKKEMQMLNSSQSLPSLVDGDHDVDLSEAKFWEQETATGRVLLQSLANENKLEEELILSKQEIRQLTDQLHQLKADYERDSEENRGTVHALLKKVDEISKKKQEELDMREQENRAKEDVIRQLQKTLQDAETAIKVMEKVLDDTKRCLNLERKQSSTKDQALLQIYGVVKPNLGIRNEDMNQENGNEEMRKGIVSKTPLLVAERVKGYVEGRENQVLKLLNQVKETEQRLRDYQSETEGTAQKLKAEHKERLIQLNESHDKQLESVSERASNARKQTLGLQAQITTVEEHSQLEIKAKERQITELTATIQSLQERLEESAAESQIKLQNIQTQLQSTQSLLEDRNAASLQLETEMTSLRTQLTENEETMKGTSNTLNEVMSKNGTLSKEKEECLKKLSEWKKLLEEKEREITQLTEKLREDEEKNERQLQQEISRLETDSKHEIVKREKESEIQLTAWRENLEKVQTELEKRNLEIGLQQEASQAIVIKTKELKSQVEIITKEKAELALMLGARDKDLIVLQHERNLLENLYEKSRKESQLELRNKDKLEGDLQELEPRYRELLVENQELLNKLEKEAKKVSEIVEDNTNMQNELDRTKKDLEKVKLSKSDVVKKLSIREKRLKHVEEDLMKEGKRLEVKNLELEKLQKERQSLEAELKKENMKLGKLAKGNASTLQQVSEQQARNEKEKRILNSQISILQNELRLVRGALHANKAVDGKAVQFAEDMRKNAEVKRSLLESLQSKNYQLEEQLDVAQRNVDRLEVENKNLQASCKKAERRFESLQKENGDMASRRKEQKTLLVKLEQALEKAAFKFSESQRVREKQEQDLARLKLQHQLELKELKGNLLNQFTTTHILPKVKNTSSEIPANNITPSKQGASLAVSTDMKVKPKVGKIGQDLETKEDVEEELKRFLGEMYQMLRGKGASRGRETQQNDLQEDVLVRKTRCQWKNQSVTSCEKEPFLESSRDHSGHTFLSFNSEETSLVQDDKEENLSDIVSDDQSPIIGIDRLSPVSTLLHQEELPRRYISREMKSTKANLDKIQSQTKKEKVVKTQNQATKGWNNAKEDEMNIKMVELQRKLERLAVIGTDLKDNNKGYDEIIFWQDVLSKFTLFL